MVTESHLHNSWISDCVTLLINIKLMKVVLDGSFKLDVVGSGIICDRFIFAEDSFKWSEAGLNQFTLKSPNTIIHIIQYISEPLYGAKSSIRCSVDEKKNCFVQWISLKLKTYNNSLLWPTVTVQVKRFFINGPPDRWYTEQRWKSPLVLWRDKLHDK